MLSIDSSGRKKRKWILAKVVGGDNLGIDHGPGLCLATVVLLPSTILHGSGLQDPVSKRDMVDCSSHVRRTNWCDQGKYGISPCL